MALPLPSSNTDSISKTDRATAGIQPDQSTPTGSVATMSPTGAAGGDLTGNFPNPTIGAGKVTLAKITAIPTDTILGNPTGSTASPSAISLGFSTVLARLATGDIVAATPTQTTTMLAGAVCFSGTVALAQLTPVTGSPGTLTVVKGLITAYSAPT